MQGKRIIVWTFTRLWWADRSMWFVSMRAVFECDFDVSPLACRSELRLAAMALRSPFEEYAGYRKWMSSLMESVRNAKPLHCQTLKRRNVKFVEVR